MPSKTEEYLALAQRTANGLTRYWESWTDYLTTASRLYKYPFADQLMIYAQRPDATACADFDIWNNRMNRYVRRGAKGIALLDESSGFPRLHYVFDVSDTGVRRNSRDPEVWQLGPDLVQPVSEMLSKTYGISGERVSQQLADVAGKLVADYWDNNSGDILAIVDGSLLMDYDEAGVEMQFKSAAAISVTYTLLERCGFEPAGWFDKDDFQAIYNFSTPDSVYALGAAVSDMSREVLRNIERTVKTTIRRRNAERSQYEYEQQERDLLDRRGLPAPEPDPEPAPEAAGQVRQAAPDVPDEPSPSAVQHDAPEREPVPAPDGGGADGRKPDAADHGAVAETDPGPGQGAASDGVGAAHEQSESTGRGTGAERTDLQLSFFDAHIPTEAKQIESIDQAESEKSPSAFVLSQAEIENALRRGSNVEGSKLRIWKIYQLQPDRKLRAKALANEYVGDTVFVGSTTLGNSSLNLYLREYHDNALAMYPAISKIKEGHLPEKASEIALSEDSLRYLGLDAAVGDTVSLDMRVSVMDGSLPEFEYCGKFILTGILESSYIGYSTGTVEGIVGNGTAEKLLPEKYLLYSTDFKTHDKKNFQSIVYDLAKNLDVEDRYIQYNWILLDAVGISYDETSNSDAGAGFSFMTVACVLVGLLVLFAAGLVIYNILKISITKRIKEYGTLRAIGGERGQIYRLVSLQLLILCGIGIPIGLVLGTLAAKATLIAATGALNPDIFMANSVSELNEAISAASTVKFPMLLASIAVTLLFALMAAFPAARYASRVSPTVAMSGQSVKIKRRRKRNHKIYNFEAYYARLNLKRGRGRTLLTILSLVMSITVFVALQSFTGLLDASSSIQDMYFSDYAVTNETSGIPAEAISTLEANDTVKDISTVRLSVFTPGAGDELPFETDLSVQSHETFQLVNIDDGLLEIYAPNLSDQDKQALNNGTGCLVKNPIPFSYGDTPVEHTELSIGDTIQLGSRALRVIGIIDTPITINNEGFTNGVQLIVNEEIYCSLMQDDTYSEIYLTLQDGVDTNSFESILDDWCSKYPGAHWLSYLESSNEMAESFEQIKILCWVLIIFIGIIGILNIINTVYSNIHTRVNEIGMQRAIGMSAASLYKTFLWEGAYYAIFASVIGAVLGYVCCIFVGAAKTDALQLVAVPVIAIIEAAVVSVAACLLATAIPLHSIAKMYEFDLGVLNSERAYITNTMTVSGAADDCAAKETSDFKQYEKAVTVTDTYHETKSRFAWIGEIENEQLLTALETLKVEDLEIITMYAYEGYTVTEISKVLGVAQPTISIKIKRITKFLKNFNFNAMD